MGNTEQTYHFERLNIEQHVECAHALAQIQEALDVLAKYPDAMRKHWRGFQRTQGGIIDVRHGLASDLVRDHRDYAEYAPLYNGDMWSAETFGEIILDKAERKAREMNILFADAYGAQDEPGSEPVQP